MSEAPMRVPKSGQVGMEKQTKKALRGLTAPCSYLEEFRQHYLPRAFKAGGLGTLSPKQTGERLAEQSLVIG